MKNIISQKRASSLVLGELGGFILSSFLLLFIFASTGVINPLSAQNNYLSKDAAFLIETEMSIGSNVYFEYPNSMSKTTLSLDENKVKSKQNDQEANKYAKYFPNDYAFTKSPLYKLPHANSYAATKLIFSKSGNELFIQDGLEKNTPVIDNSLQSFVGDKKTDSFSVTVDLSTPQQRVILNDLAAGLVEQLNQKGFVLVEEKDATYIIHLESLSTDKTAVYYSLENEFQTKILASHVIEGLSPILSLTTAPLSDSWSLSPTITLSLSSDSETTTFLTSPQNRRAVSMTIAGILSNCFEEACS